MLRHPAGRKQHLAPRVVVVYRHNYAVGRPANLMYITLQIQHIVVDHPIVDELHGAACFVVDEFQTVSDRSGAIRAHSGAGFADDLAALRVKVCSITGRI